MKVNLIFLFTCLSLFLTACKKEPDQVLPDFPWDCDYDIGTYEILPSSYTKIPYEGKQKVVFEDSLGHEAIFLVSTTQKLHEKSVFTEITHDPDTQINYCYYSDSKEYSLTNDSLQLRIKVTLFANPYFSAPFDHLIADQLHLNVETKAIYSFYATFGFFNTLIDQRTFPNQNSPVLIDSVTCFNRTFYHVENQPPVLNFTCSVFYTAIEGVVIFDDRDGKRWRFERFE